MGKGKTPKLDLTQEERLYLRKNKIKLAEIKSYRPEELAGILGSTQERARELIALALFQSIPSIGPNLAHNVVIDLGYYDFEQLRSKKGEELIIELEKKYGVWMDPCVEDSLRCVVYHANNPGSEKNWWDFTAERKRHREQYGYPDDRPVKAWNA
ncbi:helix-hairpin-helix domain-containing protein [Peribacillus sp. SCS-155]|uniref:helix-hairpin-helix domain-containing protein n=1 Tax=Peribacillus sedimenti TaxID=3115297 RepID=UPI003906185E